MTKHFASIADTDEKAVSFREVGAGCYAFTASGDPNSGVVIGDKAVLVVDAQATPATAKKVLAHIKGITDKPVKYVALTHYHAVRTLGASAYGAGDIITSDLTRRLIADRGEADWVAQKERFPRLFEDCDSIPGLTKPTLSFASSMSIDLGNKEVRLMHLGRGHTMGDVVVWVPDAAVLFAGDLVENKVACYCGDAHLDDWPRALERISAFRPKALVPGRGEALLNVQEVKRALDDTREFIETLRDTARTSVRMGRGLKATYNAVREAMDACFGAFAIYDHCMPFNVARAYDEALGIEAPQIWTRERDQDLWDALKEAEVAQNEPEVGLNQPLEPLPEELPSEVSEEETLDLSMLDISEEFADEVRKEQSSSNKGHLMSA